MTETRDQTETMAPGERLAGLAKHAFTAEPDREAIEFEGRWVTYGEIGVIAQRVAELVRGAGPDRRAPVAFAPRNHPSAIAALMGLVSEMRNIRMMYAYQSGEALAGNVERIKASIVVAAEEDFSPELVESLRKGGRAAVMLTPDGAEYVPGLEKATVTVDPAAPEHPTFEMLTSGTTGAAKLWPLTYELLEERFVSRNSVFGAAALADLPPTLLCYPLCNISGLYTAVPAIASGMRVLLQNKFTLEGWLDWVKRYRPPYLYLPPVGIKMLLDADVPRELLSSATHCRSGMTTVPIELQVAFKEKYGMPIVMSYGATEFGGVVVQMEEEDALKWGDAKLGSTGRAYGEAQVRVADPDTGEILPPGREGLLEVLVPSIKDGWSRTSDVAKIDEDGFVFILGRADGAIMRGGFKILPEIVESALIQHSGVRAAAVVGIEDERLGQVPGALIELHDSAGEVTVAELEAHVRRHVPATHVPAVWKFTDEIPRTASLKISRKEVQAILSDD
jgi:acyl-coenzyme A synthetase/AMP-(fatty) acid ligase